jgi:heterodisulfide reductase subunit B
MEITTPYRVVVVDVGTTTDSVEAVELEWIICCCNGCMFLMRFEDSKIFRHFKIVHQINSLLNNNSSAGYIN